MDKLRRFFPIKKVADAGALAIEEQMNLYGWFNIPKHIYTEVLEPGAMAKIDVDDNLIDNAGKNFGTSVNTASFRGTTRVRSVFGFLEFGTPTHHIAPLTAKALHWGGNPGFFSKGHDVLGITAKHFWTVESARANEYMEKVVDDFLANTFRLS